MILEHRSTDKLSGRTTLRPTMIRYGAAITPDEFAALKARPTFHNWLGTLPELDEALAHTKVLTEVQIGKDQGNHFVFFSLTAKQDTFEDRREIVASIEAFCNMAVKEHALHIMHEEPTPEPPEFPPPCDCHG